MSGRITQHRAKADYLLEIGWDAGDFSDLPGECTPNWNVLPGSRPLLMHRLGDDKPQIDRINWGYRPAWAAEKDIPMAIKARIETAATGQFFHRLWRAGRSILPADGWYEWTGEPRN